MYITFEEKKEVFYANMFEIGWDLTKLEKEGKEYRTMPNIIPTEKVVFTNLIKVVDAYIDEVENQGYADDDFEHYIYEEALKAFYGKDVFKWINWRLRQ